MIDLAQAELQLNEHDAQPSLLQPTLFSEPNSLNNGTEPFIGKQSPENEHISDGLLSEARSEVECIRLSLAQSFTLDSDSVQEQVARHSRRTSRLLEETHKRLSQRWSSTLPRNCADDTASSVNRPMLSVSHAPIVEDEPRPIGRNHDLTQAPQYQLFRSWFLQHHPRKRFSCFEALLRDLTSSHAEERDEIRHQLVQDEASLPDIMVLSIPRAESRTPIRPTQELLRSIQEQSTRHVGRLLESGGGRTVKGEPFGLNIYLLHRDREHLPPKVVDSLSCKLKMRLSLSWNRLATLPQNLCPCIHLRHLDLSHNNFKDLPEPIFLLYFLWNLGFEL
jgi:hypothetical protein